MTEQINLIVSSEKLFYQNYTLYHKDTTLFLQETEEHILPIHKVSVTTEPAKILYACGFSLVIRGRHFKRKCPPPV